MMTHRPPTLLRALQLFVALPLVLLVATTSGCGGDSEHVRADAFGGERPERARFKNLDRAGRQVSEFDLDGNGEPDQWKIASGGKVIRIERDLNFDGRPDVYQYPDGAGGIAEEEMDLDVDGVIDVVSYFRGQELIRKEISIDFTGALSIVKFYVGGKLDRVERDGDGDGVTDTWEYYENDRLQRVGRDIDGDGKPDVFDEQDS